VTSLPKQEKVLHVTFQKLDSVLGKEKEQVKYRKLKRRKTHLGIAFLLDSLTTFLFALILL
jgi:hypothetical protein